MTKKRYGTYAGRQISNCSDSTSRNYKETIEISPFHRIHNNSPKQINGSDNARKTENKLFQIYRWLNMNVGCHLAEERESRYVCVFMLASYWWDFFIA